MKLISIKSLKELHIKYTFLVKSVAALFFNDKSVPLHFTRAYAYADIGMKESRIFLCNFVYLKICKNWNIKQCHLFAKDFVLETKLYRYSFSCNMTLLSKIWSCQISYACLNFRFLDAGYLHHYKSSTLLFYYFS